MKGVRKMRNVYVELKKKVERNEQLTAMDIEHIETLKGFFTTRFGSIYLRKEGYDIEEGDIDKVNEIDVKKLIEIYLKYF